MNISSPVFDNGENIPPLYTCDGANINPPLEISGVPDFVDSLALIVEDPDAPKGIFTHWLIWNINPLTTKISENITVDYAEQGMNDAGGVGYTGPCPPSGIHHYHFKLYALDKNLDLTAAATREELLDQMKDHILAQAEITGLYGSS